MIIAIDFDGTIVKHKYPEIGKPVPFAIPTIKELQDEGHLLILLTMRAGLELRAALEYCEDKGIKFFGVNENPGQEKWAKSRKVYAHLYIDDCAAGAPLIFPGGRERPYLDWYSLKNWLIKNFNLFNNHSQKDIETAEAEIINQFGIRG